MKLSFYTIDDLRLGPNLWTESRFDTVPDALSHYRSLPGGTVKELGLISEEWKLPLIRRTALVPAREPQENVLVTGQLIRPPWRGAPEVLSAARKCVSALKVRYCLDRDRGTVEFVSAPAVEGQFHGTGDLFASVLTGGLVRGWSLAEAAGLAADFVSRCAQRTREEAPRREGVDFEPLLWRLGQRMEEEPCRN
jgi:hypothetical protein